MDDVRLAIDPTAGAEELSKLWGNSCGRGELHDAIVSNPNLPTMLLEVSMQGGDRAAWFNPSAAILLLARPSQRLVAGAIKGFIFPLSYPIYQEDMDTTMRALERHVDNHRPRSGGSLPETRQYAQRIAELFKMPWP